jgi:glycosyltransferase involved in cell wall biosynthesis
MRINMIGLKALPPQYSGFETAADEISRRLVELGHQVVFYNRKGLSTHRGDDYHGVRLVTLPTIQTKNLSTIVHSFLATLHVLFHPVDVVHYFITGTTLFAFLPRLAGMKVVCSVDGTDWQRAKWSWPARTYLRLSERIAVWFCNALIADSREVQEYYREKYHSETKLITYGIRESNGVGGEWLERLNLSPQDYVLFVGRLVPENCVHHLVAAFEQVRTDKKLVIVGDDPWGKEYISRLKSTRDPRIIFTGGIYGDGYVALQKNAYMFVLPDEVGGTHPALVEAMGFGNCVLVNDTPSNLEVVADAGYSYRGSENELGLRRQLQRLLDTPSLVVEARQKAREHAKTHYSWQHVVLEHERLYRSLLGAQKDPSASRAWKREGML